MWSSFGRYVSMIGMVCMCAVIKKNARKCGSITRRWKIVNTHLFSREYSEHKDKNAAWERNPHSDGWEISPRSLLYRKRTKLGICVALYWTDIFQYPHPIRDETKLALSRIKRMTLIHWKLSKIMSTLTTLRKFTQVQPRLWNVLIWTYTLV